MSVKAKSLWEVGELTTYRNIKVLQENGRTLLENRGGITGMVKTVPPSKWSKPGQHLTWGRLLAWAGLSLVGIWLLAMSPAGDWVKTNVEQQLLFKARKFLGQEHALDSRIKAFTFDDASASEFSGADLTLEQWGTLIRALSEQKPKVIMVDRGFYRQEDAAATAAFNEQLQALDTPVIVSGFVSTQQIESRSALPFDRQEYVLTRYFNLDGTKFPKTDWLPQDHNIPYGPHVGLLPSFAGVGHAEYDGSGYIKPFYRLSPSQVMPHWALLVADSVRIDRGDLVVDKARLHPDRHGRLLVNLVDAKNYQSRTKSISTLFNAVSDNRVNELVNTGDVVMLLPQVYAASSAAKDTPNGIISAPYFSLAVLNSVLSGKWLKDPFPGLWAIIVPAMMSIVLAVWVPAASQLTWLACMAVGFVAIGLIGFVWFGLLLPWALACLSLLSTSWSITIGRSWVAYWKRKHVKAALNGVMPTSQLEDIIQSPSNYTNQASEQVVTLMYIDVVGFARAADTRSPREVFVHLKNLTERITSTVHQHGGVVDKVLGDGVLCYFGQQLTGGKYLQNHADQALRCAIKLQRDNLQLCLDSHLSRAFVNPLRIGIHTGAVFIDAMTKARRVDFTVVGHGVNFAKHLQTACDSHKVMLGATTCDLLTSFDIEADEFRQCSVKILNHQDPFEAYEYNPFAESPDILAQARQQSLAVVEGDRKDTRWPVVPRGVIQMTSDRYFGMVIDFSKCGLAVRMQDFLPTGSEISITLGSRDGKLQEHFQKEGMASIRAKVRWSRKTTDGYLHGFSLAEIDEERGEKFVKIMRCALRGSVVRLDQTGTQG